MTRKSKGKFMIVPLYTEIVRPFFENFIPSVFGRDGFNDEKVDTRDECKVLSTGVGDDIKDKTT
jgi:hypothetical protein